MQINQAIKDFRLINNANIYKQDLSKIETKKVI